MSTTTPQTNRGQLASLRRLVPRRPLEHHEALRIAELQANRLLAASGFVGPPVPEAVITALPRLQVLRAMRLPPPEPAIGSTGPGISTSTAVRLRLASASPWPTS